MIYMEMDSIDSKLARREPAPARLGMSPRSVPSQHSRSTSSYVTRYLQTFSRTAARRGGCRRHDFSSQHSFSLTSSSSTREKRDTPPLANDEHQSDTEVEEEQE